MFQIIIPLMIAFIAFNLINLAMTYFSLSSIIFIILKFILPIILFIYISIKIIPYSEKLKKSLNSPVKKLSQTAVALSAESKISPLQIPGFTGLYAKFINKLLR